MLRLLLLLAAVPLLAACGGGKCAGQHTGAWSGSLAVGTVETVSLDADCDFEHAVNASGKTCSSTGIYTAPTTDANQGTVPVTIASRDISVGGPATACLPVGMYTCAYALSSDKLVIDCGAGPRSLTRQQ